MKFNELIKFLLSFVVAFSASGSFAAPVISPVANSAAASKERSRLEALFIWKTSEELKLDAPTEQKFTEIIQSLNTRRREANAKMDAAIASLSQAKTKSESEKALKIHRAALREVQAVQTAEIDQLQPLLGPEKLVQYITVKNSILEKLKVMLAAPGGAPATTPAEKPSSEKPSGEKPSPPQASH